MTARIHRILGYLRANVVGALALTIALASTAYGAQLVSGRQVQDGSLSGADVKNRSLTAQNLSSQAAAAGARRGPRGPRGLRGLPGRSGYQGPQGAPGPQGPRGHSGLARVDATKTGSSSSAITVNVTCPPGTAPISGGGWAATGDPGAPHQPGIAYISQLERGPSTYGVRFSPDPDELGANGSETIVYVTAFCKKSS